MVKEKPHFVTVGTQKEKIPSIAYEDIRLKPKTKLADELELGSMEDPYAHVPKSIYTAHNNAIFNGENVDPHNDPQPADKADEAPVSPALLIRSNGVNIETSEQIKKCVEKDIGELSGKISSTKNLDVHSLSSQWQIILLSIRSQIGLRQVTEKDIESASNGCWVYP